MDEKHELEKAIETIRECVTAVSNNTYPPELTEVIKLGFSAITQRAVSAITSIEANSNKPGHHISLSATPKFLIRKIGVDEPYYCDCGDTAVIMMNAFLEGIDFSFWYCCNCYEDKVVVGDGGLCSDCCILPGVNRFQDSMFCDDCLPEKNKVCSICGNRANYLCRQDGNESIDWRCSEHIPCCPICGSNDRENATAVFGTMGGDFIQIYICNKHFVYDTAVPSDDVNEPLCSRCDRVGRHMVVNSDGRNEPRCHKHAYNQITAIGSPFSPGSYFRYVIHDAHDRAGEIDLSGKLPELEYNGVNVVIPSCSLCGNVGTHVNIRYKDGRIDHRCKEHLLGCPVTGCGKRADDDSQDGTAVFTLNGDVYRRQFCSEHASVLSKTLSFKLQHSASKDDEKRPYSQPELKNVSPRNDERPYCRYCRNKATVIVSVAIPDIFLDGKSIEIPYCDGCSTPGMLTEMERSVYTYTTNDPSPCHVCGKASRNALDISPGITTGAMCLCFCDECMPHDPANQFTSLKEKPWHYSASGVFNVKLSITNLLEDGRMFGVYPTCYLCGEKATVGILDENPPKYYCDEHAPELRNTAVNSHHAHPHYPPAYLI